MDGCYARQEEGEHHLLCISFFALGGSVLLSVTSHCIIASLACLVFLDGSIPTSDLSVSSYFIISSLAGFLDGSALMSDCHVSDQSLHQYFTGMSGVLRWVNTNVRSVSDLLLHHIFTGMVLRWISTDIRLLCQSPVIVSSFHSVQKFLFTGMSRILR